MTVFRNVMVYLGLGPDEEYEDGYFLDEDDDRRRDDSVRRLPTQRSGDQGREFDEPSAVGAVRPLRPVDDSYSNVGRQTMSERLDADRQFDSRYADGGHGEAPVVDLVAEERHYRESSSSQFNDTPVVRAVPMRRTKPVTLAPETFGDAKAIADEFKRSTPVIMNLQGLDRELARRLIDFASGVCYSLSGSMEKIASQVFLLTPKSVEVSDEDRRRIEERGFAR